MPPRCWNHCLLRRLVRSCARRNRFRLRGGSAAEPDQLARRRELLILGAQAFRFESEQSSRRRRQLAGLSGRSAGDRGLQTAPDAREYPAHGSFGQTSQGLSDRVMKRSAHRRRGAAQEAAEEVFQLSVARNAEQFRRELLFFGFAER